MNVFHMLLSVKSSRRWSAARARLTAEECGCSVPAPAALGPPPRAARTETRQTPRAALYLHTDRYRREIIRSEGFFIRYC